MTPLAPLVIGLVWAVAARAQGISWRTSLLTGALAGAAFLIA